MHFSQVKAKKRLFRKPQETKEIKFKEVKSLKMGEIKIV